MQRFQTSRKKIILDPTDIQILNILQNNADIHVNHLATKVHKSINSTHHRISRLQDSGVIKRYVAILDRELVGRPTLVVTMVKLKHHSTEILRAFAMEMQLLNEVQFCLHTAGEFDFLLHVTVCTNSDYEDFLEHKLCSLEMVDKIQSSFVLRECKMMTAMPLAE